MVFKMAIISLIGLQLTIIFLLSNNLCIMFRLIYLLFSHQLINYLVKLSIHKNSKFCY